MARSIQEYGHLSGSILPVAHDHPDAGLVTGEGVVLCHWHYVFRHHTHLPPMATVSITGLADDMAVLEDTHSW